MPDIKFDTLEVIPEGLRESAKQVDGKFVVNVVPNSKLSEFRDKNVALMQELDGLKPKVTKYETLIGADPAKFETELVELRQTATKVKDGTLKTSDAVTKEVDARLEAATDGLRGQMQELGTKLAASLTESTSWKSKFERSVLHQQITNAVVGKDSVANPEALPDILSRAESLFHVMADGSIVPKKGDVVVYGADGASPMTPKEWLTKLVGESPYLGKSSAGGGAAGNRPNGNDNYGMSAEAFSQLSPVERIARHRAANK